MSAIDGTRHAAIRPLRLAAESGRPAAREQLELDVKFTRYFRELQQRPDRAIIKLEWIQRAVDHAVKEVRQQDGRIRRWAEIPEMSGRYLRVILLADGETVHNAFFDRSFKP